MSKTYDIRQIGGDKIALLGLFVASLLAARLVVGIKSAIVLSAPIPLPRTGLSASVPRGNGWESRARWARDGGTFILSSSFPSGSREPTAWVICQYRPAIERETPTMQFERRARKLDGAIVEINQTVTDSLIFDWAHVKGRETRLTLFLAAAALSDDRQLYIEVYEGTGDAEQAEQVFKKVIESVNLEDSRLRTAATRGTSKEKELL